MRIISWNVNGIRAVVKKDFLESFEKLDADIMCFQETKAQDDQVAGALNMLTEKAYHLYSNSAVKKGYSGTAVLTKTKPISVSRGLGIEEHDQEGRILTLEFDDYYLTNVYVPNSKNDLSRLEYRKEWDAEFLEYLKALEKKKPVIMCGDLNVAHTEIDLARPKANYNKSAGFTQTEIDGLDNFVASGLKDSFRYLYPEKKDIYTWWSYRAGARARNVGWRIDYFLTSEKVLPKLKDAFVCNEILGSDHCPIGIDIE